MGVESDSKLITSQITEEYLTKDLQLCKYLSKVRGLEEKFKFFKAIHVPREQNSRADLLAKLASTKRPGNNRTVIQETVSTPITESQEVLAISDEVEGWMTPIVKYLTGAFSPRNEEETQMIKRREAKFTMVAGKLYKMGRATPMLRYLGEDETDLVLLEVHEEVCGSHLGGQSLAAKLLKVG